MAASETGLARHDRGSFHGQPGQAAPTSGRDAAALRQLLVVVLNYNGIADTLDCLDSLRAQTYAQDGPGLAVLVIDNGSRTDDLGRIAARFAEVEVVALGENRGWAGGNNVGLRLGLERGFEHICLLNNDTVLRPDALEELLAAAVAVGEPCLMHPVSHDFEDPTHPQLAPGPAPATSDDTARRLAEQHDVVEIACAYGACLLVPAAVPRRIGLLDERFFLQMEEEDYFRRARALGLRSYCARRARILHKVSASFGGRITPGKTYYQMRNRLLLTEKHEATPRGVLRALRELHWTLRNQAGSVRRGAVAWPGFVSWLVSADPLARAARQGFRDYALRRFGPRPGVSHVAPTSVSLGSPPFPPVAPGSVP